MPRPAPGTVLTELDRERVERVIRTTCAASLMSDTKWRKFFAVLERFPDVDQYLLKFLRYARVRSGSGGFSGHATPHAFIDSMSFGPFWMREIEWIEFPRLAPRREGKRTTLVGAKEQNIDGLRAALAEVGTFPLEDTARGLRLIGHVRMKAERKAAG